MFKSHARSGVLVWSAALPLLPPSSPLMWVTGAAVAFGCAGGPDLDHPSSIASRQILGPLRRPLVSGIGPVPGVAKLLGGHRHGAHSVWSVMVVYYLATWVQDGVNGIPELGLWHGSWLPFAVAAGWVAHILGDLLTDKGVALLWPLSGRMFKLPGWLSMTTNGRAERLFNVGQTLAIPVVLVVSHPDWWAWFTTVQNP